LVASETSYETIRDPADGKEPALKQTNCELEEGKWHLLRITTELDEDGPKWLESLVESGF
jgi:hypothetical protein